MIRHHLPCLHTINPDFAPTVAEMYESLGETSEWLTDVKEMGGFRIEARPVVNRVIPPLRQLFFSLTCGRHEFTASHCECELFTVYGIRNTIHTKMEYKYNPARVHLEYIVFVFTI